MRGHAADQLPLFHVFSVEDRIRPDHPLRDIKRRVDRLLTGMSAAFAEAYSETGRPSTSAHVHDASRLTRSAFAR